jgi:2-amino-4-hydroxy-6-hydroxymethyldihydropteridine diphosphokinase
MNIVYLLLGSNLNNRLESLNEAKQAIASTLGKIAHQSSVYESEPWGFDAENRFLNQVIRIETPFNPNQVLDEILKIETQLGRIRKPAGVYSSRVIDIDILFYNDEIIAAGNLIIPHPRIQDRMFTLMPLSEMNQHMIHPSLNKSIKELIDECSDNLHVYPYQPELKI